MRRGVCPCMPNGHTVPDSLNAHGRQPGSVCDTAGPGAGPVPRLLLRHGGLAARHRGHQPGHPAALPDPAAADPGRQQGSAPSHFRGGGAPSSLPPPPLSPPPSARRHSQAYDLAASVLPAALLAVMQSCCISVRCLSHSRVDDHSATIGLPLAFLMNELLLL